MEISVEIVKILPVQSFVSGKTGQEMRRHSFVGKTLNAQYPKQICFQVFGDDKFNEMRIAVGKTYAISFDIESRMVNTAKGEQWFTSVNVWKALCIDNGETKSNSNATTDAVSQMYGGHVAKTQPTQTVVSDSGSDLPF